MNQLLLLSVFSSEIATWHHVLGLIFYLIALPTVIKKAWALTHSFPVSEMIKKIINYSIAAGLILIMLFGLFAFVNNEKQTEILAVNSPPIDSALVAIAYNGTLQERIHQLAFKEFSDKELMVIYALLEGREPNAVKLVYDIPVNRQSELMYRFKQFLIDLNLFGTSKKDLSSFGMKKIHC